MISKSLNPIREQLDRIEQKIDNNKKKKISIHHRCK